MNQEIKTKWVEALRSGNYRQTTRYLYSPKKDAYCCLGVLVDLYISAKDLREEDTKNKPLIEDLSEAHFNQMPSPEVADWADLGETQMIDAAGMNDNGQSFDKIANYIEKNY